MNPRVAKREEARRDLVNQFEYLAARSLELGDRFLLAAESTFELLARGPNLGERFVSSNPAMRVARRWRIEGFPNHLVFYRPIHDGVEIIRVLHAARAWMSLLEPSG